MPGTFFFQRVCMRRFLEPDGENVVFATYMHPVEPSTIVRGPDALTMCRMTSADSHPWQVRCPETKSSSYGTSFTPLIGGSAVVSTAITSSLRRSSDRCHRP